MSPDSLTLSKGAFGAFKRQYLSENFIPIKAIWRFGQSVSWFTNCSIIHKQNVQMVIVSPALAFPFALQLRRIHQLHVIML